MKKFTLSFSFLFSLWVAMLFFSLFSFVTPVSAALMINNFSANPQLITEGDTTNLVINVTTNDTKDIYCTVSGPSIRGYANPSEHRNVPPVTLSVSLPVQPSSDASYSVSCENTGGKDKASRTTTVLVEGRLILDYRGDSNFQAPYDWSCDISGRVFSTKRISGCSLPGHPAPTMPYNYMCGSGSYPACAYMDRIRSTAPNEAQFNLWGYAHGSLNNLTLTARCTGVHGIVSVSASNGACGIVPPPPPVPAPDLKINGSNGPIMVNVGDNLNITWDPVANATSCIATSGAGWVGSAKSAAGGSNRILATVPSVYTIQCEGPGGRGSDSVIVNAPPEHFVADPACTWSNSIVNLSWFNGPGFLPSRDIYQVYRCIGASCTPAVTAADLVKDNLTENLWGDITVSGGVVYKYIVRARVSGVWSAATAPVTVTAMNPCPPAFSCLPPSISNATVCTGDDAGLAANTGSTVVDTCGGPASPKCEFTCNSGYVKSGNACAAVTTPTLTLRYDSCSGSLAGNSLILSKGTTKNVVACDENGVDVTNSSIWTEEGNSVISLSGTAPKVITAVNDGSEWFMATRGGISTVQVNANVISPCICNQDDSVCKGKKYTGAGPSCVPDGCEGTKDCRKFWKEVAP